MAATNLQKNKLEPQHSEFGFTGFKSTGYTAIPDEFFDNLAAQLSEAELRVMLYIMRRTLGFRKRMDAISLSQLTNGICRRDGTILDRGTGLSKPAVLKAINSLAAKGIISVEKSCNADGRNEINIYKVCFADESVSDKLANKDIISINSYSDYEYKIIDYSADEVYKLPVASGFSLTEKTEKQITQNKAELSTPVIQVNEGSKFGSTGWVKQHDQQHGRIQNNISQINNKQLLCSTSPLALEQSQAEKIEPVEVQIDGDQLYIAFRKLVLALMEFGLPEKLAIAYCYKYPEEYLLEKIELTKKINNSSSHQKTLHNTAGYLRRAIEENYQPSPVRNKVPTSLPSTASAGRNSFKSYTIEPEMTLLRGASSRAATQSANTFEYTATDAVGVIAESSNPPGLNPAVLWQQTLEDLEARFRFDAATMALLQDSFLETGAANILTIWLAQPWQERLLTVVARNQIKLALRQQMAASCTILFKVVETG